MRSVVAFGTREGEPPSAGAPFARATVDDRAFPCAVIETAPPVFDAAGPAHRHEVLLRIKAFSCNYRDRYFFHRLADAPHNRFFTIGSEFAAEVVAVGRDVSTVRPGDRVISNHHYTGPSVERATPIGGVVTNHAAREYQIQRETSVIGIPACMTDETGAAFGLGAQTAYSMIKRIPFAPPYRALVTAAGSNTSLFLIAALSRRAGVEVHAATTSTHVAAALERLGVRGVVTLPRGAAAARRRALAEYAAAVKGFDCVLDPFFDLHVEGAVEALNAGGVYVTCGLAAQTDRLAASSGVSRPANGSQILFTAINRNLTLVGNCLGRREDLAAALHDYEKGALDVAIDSVFSGGDDAAPFVERTFTDPRRFGKVVFRYDS